MAADLQEADTAEGEPAAADLGAADTAPAGPQHDDAASVGLQHDDTVKMPAVPAVLSGGQHRHPQVPEQPVGSEPVQTPVKRRRFRYLALAATALAALLIGAWLFAVGRDGGVTAARDALSIGLVHPFGGLTANPQHECSDRLVA